MQLHISSVSHLTVTVDDELDRVESIKQTIKEQLGLQLEEIILSSHQGTLDNNKTIKSCSIRDGDTITLLCPITTASSFSTD